MSEYAVKQGTNAAKLSETEANLMAEALSKIGGKPTSFRDAILMLVNQVNSGVTASLPEVKTEVKEVVKEVPVEKIVEVEKEKIVYKAPEGCISVAVTPVMERVFQIRKRRRPDYTMPRMVTEAIRYLGADPEGNLYTGKR